MEEKTLLIRLLCLCIFVLVTFLSITAGFLYTTAKRNIRLEGAADKWLKECLKVNIQNDYFKQLLDKEGIDYDEYI